MSKIITVYFSRKGQNYCNGGIKKLAKGNTEVVAEFIQKAVGGDLFEVETVKSYSDDYYVCIDEAKKELHSNARPELKRYPADLGEYDVIFVGYPNWCGTMPMAMFTLLESCDLKCVKIIPFCTNEGSGMGSSERDLRKICPGAEIVDGLSICGSEAIQSENKVAEWAKRAISKA